MFLITVLVFLIFSRYGNSQTTQISGDLGIIGGHKVSIEQVPYIASLRLNGTRHFCGCSIIHERFVLTAAHCIFRDRMYKVLVGTDKVDKGGKLYDVEKILVHQMYSNKTFQNDICILKLNDTLNFGLKVNKIDLKDKSIRLRKGMMMDTAGWGSTMPNQTVSTSLQQVQVPMVPRPSCQRYYNKNYKITSRMICAGGHGKDSCMGDSGGPLTYKNAQVGITSFGAGCGIAPGVYTKVSSLLHWIKQTIDQNL